MRLAGLPHSQIPYLLTHTGALMLVTVTQLGVAVCVCVCVHVCVCVCVCVCALHTKFKSCFHNLVHTHLHWPPCPCSELLAVITNLQYNRLSLTERKWKRRTLSMPSAFNWRMTGDRLLRCISGTVETSSLWKESSEEWKWRSKRGVIS